MSCQGTVRSFYDSKAWGFITLEGKDVFVHIKDCQGAKPVQGDAVLFDLDPEKAAEGKMKAINVQGCTGSVEDTKGKGKGEGKGMGGGSLQGTVKSFSHNSGWGFIDYNGADVFCHIKECYGNPPQAGDYVSFDIEESSSKPGTMRAKNIAGGTGYPMMGGKGDAWGGGKGKGDAWGGKGGYGPAWGMDMSGGKGGWGGPYGGGGGWKGGKGGDWKGCGKGGDWKGSGKGGSWGFGGKGGW